MYKSIQEHFPEILESFEVLMSYSVGKIFTSDTPSGKEKKPLVEYYSCLGKITWFKVSTEFYKVNYLERSLTEEYPSEYKLLLKQWKKWKEEELYL